jgi:hypothetical protein
MGSEFRDAGSDPAGMSIELRDRQDSGSAPLLLFGTAWHDLVTGKKLLTLNQFHSEGDP